MVVVDDHLLLVETLLAALRADGVNAVGLRPDPTTDVLVRLLSTVPDLVLLDLDLGVFGDSTALIRPLTAAGIRVLVVTGLPDRLRIALALEQGAVGYQSKADGFDALLEATHHALSTGRGNIAAGELQALAGELAAARASSSLASAPFRSLTEREQATLRALCNGLTVRDIASAWVVSEATVRSHVQRILFKLAVGSQVQAVVLAVQVGWAGAGAVPFARSTAALVPPANDHPTGAPART